MKLNEPLSCLQGLARLCHCAIYSNVVCVAGYDIVKTPKLLPLEMLTKLETDLIQI